MDRTCALGPTITTTSSYVALVEAVGQLPQIILLSQLHSLILPAKYSKALEFATRDAVDPKVSEDDKAAVNHLIYEQMGDNHSPWVMIRVSKHPMGSHGKEASVLFYEVPRYRTKRWIRDILNPT